MPAIVSSLSTFEPASPERTFLMQTSIVLSVLGTLSVALEDFFQFGARATAMKTCVMIIDKEFWYDELWVLHTRRQTFRSTWSCIFRFKGWMEVHQHGADIHLDISIDTLTSDSCDSESN